jgi:acyl-CoA oxidase
MDTDGGAAARRASVVADHLAGESLAAESSAAPAPAPALAANFAAAAAGAAPPGAAAELQAILDHDCEAERARLKALMAAPLFTPRWNISVDEERELALERLRALCATGAFSVGDFRGDPLRIFAAHECAALSDVSMATKMTVQFNLFGGTVLKLGTRRHWDLVQTGALVFGVFIVGFCFALGARFALGAFFCILNSEP